MVFDVDGFRFGIAICIEINFPDLFAHYDRLDVDQSRFENEPGQPRQ